MNSIAMTTPSTTVVGDFQDGRGLHKPELLAPAGDWECAHAAVENGADAVYFGLQRFNARIRAHNFGDADLPPLMDFLHRRGVRGYLTFNILAFPEELAEAEQHLRTVITAGVDAVIVQDVGLARLVRRISPDFPIHASTQMTITDAAGVQFARELGASMVVLARECSIQDIKNIQSALRADSISRRTGGGFETAVPDPMPLQVFIHGALCVAYSGQCLTSEALGGRSANRGECAQACRLPYELLCDGVPVPLGDRRYLLSPQDLVGLEALPDLMRLSVSSLKIEGRLKSPEYVANITRVYREAIDLVFAEFLRASGRPDEVAAQLRADNAYEIEMAFSRGLSTGWLRGSNNQELVHGRFGKKRGVFLGEVTRVQGAHVWVKLTGSVQPGDGVVFDAGHPEGPEEGGRVYTVAHHGTEAVLGFGRGDVNPLRIHRGDKLWKTSDPRLEHRWRQSYSNRRPRFRRPITLEVRGRAGGPLTLSARDADGHEVEVESQVPLTAAEKQPLTTARLHDQLGRLGGTPFSLGQLQNRLEGSVILPVSELNRLRRTAVSELEYHRAKPRPWRITEGLSCDSDLAWRASSPRWDDPGAPELTVLVRTMAQLESALRCGVQTIYVEFEDPKKYREAVRLVRRTQADEETIKVEKRTEIWVAPPRIFKPGEEWILKLVRSSGADGFLVRNHQDLRFFEDFRCRGDYSLNVANRLSAEYFVERFGLERLTASYDLNVEQLESLLGSAPPGWFEVTIHQHMPMFHMEHCVFCAFLSTGTDYTNCGRPCDRHQVKLRDRVGAAHPVRADAGCRNTVFNALAQTGAESVARLSELGARIFRIEFMDEPPELAVRTMTRYQELVKGDITGTELWRELKLFNQIGVTRGQLASSDR
jgi:putative protease